MAHALDADLLKNENTAHLFLLSSTITSSTSMPNGALALSLDPFDYSHVSTDAETRL